MPEGQPGQPGQMGGQAGQGAAAGGQGGGMGLNRALLLSGALGFTVPPAVNGVYHTAFGDFKVGESDQEKREGEAKKEASAATLKSTAESSLGGAGTNASFEALDQLMNDPNYKNIAGTGEGKLINAQPLGLPLGSWLQKNIPSNLRLHPFLHQNESFLVLDFSEILENKIGKTLYNLDKVSSGSC